MANIDTLELSKVVELAKNKDELATRFLKKKYTPMIYNAINNGQFFLPGGEREDLFSEGLIGLMKGIEDFEESKGKSGSYEKNLDNFLYMCIRRALISALKMAMRQKHIPLNSRVSIDKTLEDNENLTTMDIVAFRNEVKDFSNVDFMDPEKRFIMEDWIERAKAKLFRDLSERERAIYHLRRKKHSYEEIQKILGLKDKKAIDNALTRIKVKLHLVTEQEERQVRNI